MQMLLRGGAIGKVYDMQRIKVLQQVLDPSGAGGVSAEFRALANSNLSDKYDFIPMVLTDFHSGLNLHDIKYYYNTINKYNPDIVHVRGAAIDGLNAVIAAKLARKGKVLVAVHGMYSDLIYINPIKKWISKNVVERIIYGLADGISCVCENAMRRSYFDCYRNKMLPFVYNRMPHYDLSLKDEYRQIVRDEYGIEQNKIVGLYVGRMTREKGLDTLIEAINMLEDKWPENLIFLFVGDGDYLAYTKSKLVRLSRDKKIVFTGTQSDVEKYYYAADFFVQPSLHENHSISLLEACAAKVPSIVTNCGGNTEIIDGQIGIIVPVEDANNLASAIVQMCDEENREQFTNELKMRDFIKFSDREVDIALDNVYTSIMER